MAGKFDKNIATVADDVRHGYRALLSGQAADLSALQELVAAYRDAGTDFATFGYLQRLKQWIANAQGTKNRTFLDALHADALSDFNNPGAGTWRTAANCARIFRYTGRFYKAQKAYTVAFNLIGNFGSHTELDKKDIADVYADYAEFRAYLGHPGEADTILGSFPGSYLKGWHQWVRAIAYHFWGHEETRPFASPNPTNKPGPETRYLQSNQFLAQARQDTNLPSGEAIDTFLVEAANWGAISRRRTTHGGDVGAAQQAATQALANFRQAGSDPVNTEWTWTKERRGRLAVFFRKKLDGALNKQQVEEWRRKFRNHYRENLVEAGILESSSSTDSLLKDGQLDSADDHVDDNQD